MSIKLVTRRGIVLWRYLLTVLLTLCGFTGQKTHRGGLWLSRLVHEEAHPSFLILVNLPLMSLLLEAPTAC